MPFYSVDTQAGDSVNLFLQDMLQGGQLVNGTNDTLARVLAMRSGRALAFLRERVGLVLDKKSCLGGHSKPRTHRPTEGMSGVETILGLEKIVKNVLQQQKRAGEAPASRLGFLRVLKRTAMTALLTSNDGGVRGISYVTYGKASEQTTGDLKAPFVLLATGGYAADFSNTSLLQKHRPGLLQYGTTNGAWATGDGHKVAMLAGAQGVDLDFVQVCHKTAALSLAALENLVSIMCTTQSGRGLIYVCLSISCVHFDNCIGRQQVHPTGFVDPKTPSAKTKTLCAELLRGVGALLLNNAGRRFVNELGTRKHITKRMGEESAAGHACNTIRPVADGSDLPRDVNKGMWFTILLNAAAAAEADKHVPLYVLL